jgi:cell division protein FtsN
MARKGRQAVRSVGWPAWLLVVIGIAIGVVGMGIVYRTGHMPISRSAGTPEPAAAVAASSGGAGIAAKTKSHKPRYDFYSVLPEKEVVIPDAEINAQAKAEQQSTQSTSSAATPVTNDAATGAAASGKYLLQVGSFPSAGDAEALKAKLALQGFRAEVKPVTVNGKTWNRVRLGPFASASKLEATKKKLDAAGIHAIALKEH